MKCGKPVKAEQEYCRDCQKTRHYFDEGRAAFTYTGDLRHSIYRMKFENRRDYLDFYGSAMSFTCIEQIKRWEPELILPVPMHKRKKRVRGYNQSELLAKIIGKQLGIPVDCKSLACIRYTRSQKELGRKERTRNLNHSFSLREGLVLPRRVLVVDDVYTTGSTLDAVSRVLKNAGVQNVFFITLCIGKGTG